MNTKMWAHRILKKIPRFDHSSPIDFGDKYDYGEYIGVYHNTLTRKNIYFFEKGFMFSDKKDDFKKYEEIHKKIPIETKTQDSFLLEMNNGEIISIKFDYQKDLFEISHFFSRLND